MRKNPSRLICSIVTPDYIDRALTVLLSLQAIQLNMPMVVLTTESIKIHIEGLSFLPLEELCDREARARVIVSKYGDELDKIRWSLKPVLLSYLIRSQPDAEVLLCDSDLCFFSSPDPIFQYLDQGGIVLTPHWRPLCPATFPSNFRYHFLDGLFNAGCVLANARGLNALNWWADACISACEKNYEEGVYDDQRYLDLMPIYFPETVVCRHLGFNLADWNVHLRQKNGQGEREVPDKWPVSLVHFTKNTICKTLGGFDPVLYPYLMKYRGLMNEAARIVSDAEVRAPEIIDFNSQKT
jgi:hypothetical protein